MIVRFSRWGDGLVLRIPAQVLRDIKRSGRQHGNLSVEQGRIVIAPRAGPPRYTFDGSLAGITADDPHDDRFDGWSVGDEI